MSVRQDRFTFFGVLAAVVIVVLGYLQLSRVYPVAGRETPASDSSQATQKPDVVEGDASEAGRRH